MREPHLGGTQNLGDRLLWLKKNKKQKRRKKEKNVCCSFVFFFCKFKNLIIKLKTKLTFGKHTQKIIKKNHEEYKMYKYISKTTEIIGLKLLFMAILGKKRNKEG